MRVTLIVLYFLPLSIMAQEEKCEDENRRIDQLPCKLANRFGTDIIPDEETAIKYVDILIRKRELLDTEKS